TSGFLSSLPTIDTISENSRSAAVRNWRRWRGSTPWLANSTADLVTSMLLASNKPATGSIRPNLTSSLASSSLQPVRPCSSASDTERALRSTASAMSLSTACGATGAPPGNAAGASPRSTASRWSLMTFSGRYWSRWTDKMNRKRLTSEAEYLRYPAEVRCGIIRPLSSKKRILEAVTRGNSFLSSASTSPIFRAACRTVSWREASSRGLRAASKIGKGSTPRMYGYVGVLDAGGQNLELY